MYLVSPFTALVVGLHRSHDLVEDFSTINTLGEFSCWSCLVVTWVSTFNYSLTALERQEMFQMSLRRALPNSGGAKFLLSCFAAPGWFSLT